MPFVIVMLLVVSMGSKIRFLVRYETGGNLTRPSTT